MKFIQFKLKLNKLRRKQQKVSLLYRRLIREETLGKN